MVVYLITCIIYIILFDQWENNKIRLGTHFNDNDKIISRSSIAVGYTIDIKQNIYNNMSMGTLI